MLQIVFLSQDRFSGNHCLAVDTASGVYGGTTTLTATLTSGGAPVGDEPVLLTLNGTAVGSAVTNGNGVATLPGVSLTGIAPGAHAGTMAASFAGNADYTGSGGSNSLVVSQAGTVTTLASNTKSSVQGQTVTFTATVSAVAPGAGKPTGTITFRDGSKVLAVIPLANGVATFSISSLPVGSDVITAAYSGNANFTGSSSAPITASVTKSKTLVVSQAGTVTTLASNINPSVQGQTVTFTATMARWRRAPANLLARSRSGMGARCWRLSPSRTESPPSAPARCP